MNKQNPKTQDPGLQTVIVVDTLTDYPATFSQRTLLTALDYLTDETLPRRGVRVINLCKHTQKLSLGYYVSLLAEARGHRVLPPANALHDLGSRYAYRELLQELDAPIQKSLERISSSHFTLSVYLGENLADTHHALARKLYQLFPCPMMRFSFERDGNTWKIDAIEQLSLVDLPENHYAFFEQQLKGMCARRWVTPQVAKTPRYEIAILHNPKEAHPPSNPQALKKFIKAAARLGMRAELILPNEYSTLLQYDALFIRETTGLDNHTLRFAKKAKREGIVVIDDPDSIRRCCNKVYLRDLMRRHKINTPQTTLIHKKNWKEVAQSQHYPCIIKIPDGAFSIGIHKLNTYDEFAEKVRSLLQKSAILLVQEFLPTDYDWRLGILDNEIIYACRYHMSRGHWQIYNHTAKRKMDQSGNSDCVELSAVPDWVKEAGLQAAAAIGNGLYGVDLKEIDKKAYVIEVNDNPSIDAGIEDDLLGDKLYDRVMRSFLDRLELKRTQYRPENDPGLSGICPSE